MEKEKLIYKFSCYGHPNIKATHVKTLEITKDDDLSERGDCIIGIKANFELSELKKFTKKAKLLIEAVDEQGNSYSDEFKFIVNQSFNSDHELVLRKSKFNSDRTFGFFLNKGASKLDKKIVAILLSGKEVAITIKSGWGD